MNTERKVIPMPARNARDWKYFDRRLTELRVNDVENILERGRVLIQMKDELEHGSFEATVKRHFTPQTARKLMTIANNGVISNRAHVRDLPPSWGTLYELTTLSPDTLRAKIRDGTINPKMERKDVRAMQPNAKPQPPSRAELIAAIQKDPNANQRDAAKALGVSLGEYQRTRNELIGSGEIKGPLTLDDLRERIAALLRELSKEERRREINRIMRLVDVNIHDWVSTMTIRRKGD